MRKLTCEVEAICLCYALERLIITYLFTLTTKTLVEIIKRKVQYLFQTYYEFVSFLFQICEVIAKAKKQDKLTVLFCLLSVCSITIGHSSIRVLDEWKESGPIWLMVVLKTGNIASDI